MAHNKRIIRPLRINADLMARLRAAVREDARRGDVTSLATIPAVARGAAVMRAKENGVICGLTVARAIFRAVDARTRCRLLADDGDRVRRGDVVMEVRGAMRSILAAERVALNFVQRLSGVATLTARFVDAIAATAGSAGCKPPGIYDTRKTTPLWRELERHAVRCGGGRNHRFCLDDMILIKDNHADAAGSVGGAVRAAVGWRRAARSRRQLKIMAEARTLDETRQALDAGADLIMLDNMSDTQIRRAVALARDWARGRGVTPAPIEVSGGVTLKRAAALARLGVDRVSVGALTHSAPALDVSLKIAGSDAQ